MRKKRKNQKNIDVRGLSRLITNHFKTIESPFFYNAQYKQASRHVPQFKMQMGDGGGAREAMFVRMAYLIELKNQIVSDGCLKQSETSAKKAKKPKKPKKILKVAPLKFIVH